MVTDTTRPSIIQHILQEKDEELLNTIERMFQSDINAPKKKSLRDLTGRITPQEADEWEKIIEETSEKIFEDDWK